MFHVISVAGRMFATACSMLYFAPVTVVVIVRQGSTQAARKTSICFASTEHTKEASLALAGPPCALYLPLNRHLRRAQGPTSARNTAAAKAVNLGGRAICRIMISVRQSDTCSLLSLVDRPAFVNIFHILIPYPQEDPKLILQVL